VAADAQSLMYEVILGELRPLVIDYGTSMAQTRMKIIHWGLEGMATMTKRSGWVRTLGAKLRNHSKRSPSTFQNSRISSPITD
jgi:hypothetical protein